MEDNNNNINSKIKYIEMGVILYQWIANHIMKIPIDY
jgi:hypothetical protein